MPTRADGKLSFKPFDEDGDMRSYYNGFLPHWRQAGCTYFATFRLADSIPKGVLEQWKHERRMWLNARGVDLDSDRGIEAFKRLADSERQTFERHFVSLFFAKLDEGLGECLLRRSRNAEIVRKALQHFHEQRWDAGDAAIMPNHVHALLTPYAGFELEEVLHSVKSYTSNQIQRMRGTTGALWMRESHDHIVRDADELIRIQDYIRNNPAKARLNPGEFSVRTAEYALS